MQPETLRPAVRGCVCGEIFLYTLLQQDPAFYAFGDFSDFLVRINNVRALKLLSSSWFESMPGSQSSILELIAISLDSLEGLERFSGRFVPFFFDPNMD